MFGSNIHSETLGSPASIHVAEANTLPHEGPRFLQANHFLATRFPQTLDWLPAVSPLESVVYSLIVNGVMSACLPT